MTILSHNGGMTSDILDIFNDRLQGLLYESDLNISDFAKKIKIPRTTITNWILGKSSPRIEYLRMIAEYFSVSCDYLVGLED